jgi:hypothetical protein
MLLLRGIRGRRVRCRVRERNKGQFGSQKRPKIGGKNTRSGSKGANKASQGNSRSAPVKPSRPEDDPAYISTGAFNVTKNGSIAAGIIALLSAVPVFLRALDVDSLPSSAIYGTFALTGLCVIAVTVLIRTDLQVRGAAKVSVVENVNVPASTEEEVNEDEPEETEEASEEEVVYDAPAAVLPVAEPFTVKLHGEDRNLVVLAVGWNPNTGAPAYLGVKPGERPRWIDDDEVQTVTYESRAARRNQTAGNGVTQQPGDHSRGVGKSREGTRRSGC